MPAYGITGTDFAALRGAVAPFDTDERRAAYRARQFPRAELVRDLDKRYRWDLFYRANGYRAMAHDYRDGMVDTALRRIVPPLSADDLTE